MLFDVIDEKWNTCTKNFLDLVVRNKPPIVTRICQFWPTTIHVHCARAYFSLFLTHFWPRFLNNYGFVDCYELIWCWSTWQLFWWKRSDNYCTTFLTTINIYDIVFLSKIKNQKRKLSGQVNHTWRVVAILELLWIWFIGDRCEMWRQLRVDGVV